MTLIELMASITIMGILLVFALPSFRGLQARESMNLAQQGIQSFLYRMQQLALAPPTSDETKYQIIGYGLAFQKRNTPAGNCQISSPNDYLAIYKFIVPKKNSSGGVDSTGQIQAILNPFDPSVPCGVGAINTIKYPKDFYNLPNNVIINETQSQQLSSSAVGLPWLLPVPLEATGTTYGDFAVGNYGYNNPLPPNTPGASSQLVIEHTYLKVGANKLCRSIKFSRDSQGVLISSRLVGGCT